MDDGDPIPIGCRLHSRQQSDLPLSIKTFRAWILSQAETSSDSLGDRIPGLASSSGSLAGNFCHAVAVFTLIGGLGSALAAMHDYGYPDYDDAGIYFGLGAAASSAPIFAIGSIAKSTRRSAKIIEWVAEQENRRRTATPDT